MYIVYNIQAVGQRCWVDYGSRTLRKDALLLHEKSMQHRDEVRAAMSHKREQADGLASMESERMSVLAKLDQMLDNLHKYYK